jgi:transposase
VIHSLVGRKTDILDCQWIQQLHTYGLLQASFRPPEDIRTLRALNDKTGGKVIRSRTLKSQNRAAAALRMAAQSLLHSDSALGSYCRHMCARLGKAEGITATTHKLARIIYAMLKIHTGYRDPGTGYYEGQARERAVKNLKRKAKELGFEVVPRPA